MAVALAAVGACKRTAPNGGAPAPADGAADAPSTSPSASSSIETSEADEEVKPVYPLDPGPPNAQVDKLCAALHDLPATRRAACCKQPKPLVLTGECRRNLGAAVNASAVTLDAAEIDRCVAALGKAYDGCAWVGPNAVAPPKECLGLVHGKVPAQARCRSSLECVDGMRCHGSGPTTPGVCGPAHATGGACGATIDVLVTYTAQADWEVTHPECVGVCDRRRCIAPVPVGGACTTALVCAAGNACVVGKCAPAAPAKTGEACPGGACAEAGVRCVAGRCVAPKKDGEPCALDAECMGGCVKDKGAKSGTCGLRCGP
ncbi:MAG: hypothetical protein NVSMB47_02200 [Polyangiales bacterium]